MSERGWRAGMCEELMPAGDSVGYEHVLESESFPWPLHVEPGRGGGRDWRVVDTRGETVANVHAPARWAQGLAQKFAAAPVMLDALRAVLAAIGDEPCRPDHHGYCQTHNLEPVAECWFGRLKAAISKVEGRER